MKDYKHLGSYGIIVDNNKILLIKKCSGPYHGKLDLPGGTVEMNERPIDTLKRELKEEVGINVIESELLDVDSVSFKWSYNKEKYNVHHIGIFYKITKYDGIVKKVNVIDNVNDDSLGADFYDISNLTSDDLSEIAWMEIKKLKENI